MENKCAIADKQFLKQLHSNQEREKKKKKWETCHFTCNSGYGIENQKKSELLSNKKISDIFSKSGSVIIKSLSFTDKTSII